MCSHANIFSRYCQYFAHFPPFRKIQLYPQSWWEIACDKFFPKNQQGPWKINGGVKEPTMPPPPPVPIQESLELARELFSSRLSRNKNRGRDSLGELEGIEKSWKTKNNEHGHLLWFGCNMDIIWINKFMNFNYKYVVSINMNTPQQLCFLCFLFSQCLDFFLRKKASLLPILPWCSNKPSWWNGSNHHTALKFKMEPKRNRRIPFRCFVSFSKWILVIFFLRSLFF